MHQDIEVGDLVEWHAYYGIRRGKVVKVDGVGKVTVLFVPKPLEFPERKEEFTLTPDGARRQLTVYEKGTIRVRKG